MSVCAARPVPARRSRRRRPTTFGALATRLTRRARRAAGPEHPSALEALRANKGRAILTTLGIVIGVAAVILIVALGQGSSAPVHDRGWPDSGPTC